MMDPLPCAEPSPWWIGIAGAIVAALVAAIGKLWSVILSQRADAERLAAARDAAIDAVNSEHKRDLRHTIGWWSHKPPPLEILRAPPLAPPPALPDPILPPRPREPRKPRKPTT